MSLLFDTHNLFGMRLHRLVLTVTAYSLVAVHAQTTVDRTPEQTDIGAPPVSGALHLFDGSRESLDNNWEMWPGAGDDISWKYVDDPVDDGKVVRSCCASHYGEEDLVTRRKFEDFEGHVEFVMMSDYSNSGVYLQNRYEIQIETPPDNVDPATWDIGLHGIAAICKEHTPDANAWRPQGEWHAFHFVFRAARWDGNTKQEDARVTVWWNGVKVHDNVAIDFAKGGVSVGPSLEGLKLQDHGTDVRFRNIWIKEIGDEAPDDTPPSQPGNLQATPAGENRIDLSWEKASDPESDIHGYVVYRDNSKIGQSTTTEYADERLPENTTYSYQVSAVNGAGLEGARSNKVSGTTDVDATPPAIVSATAAGDKTAVTVRFSEPVEQASAENVENYRIDNGITVSGAGLGDNGASVTLRVSSLSEGTTYTLTVNDVTDRAKSPNTIASNSTLSFTYFPYSSGELNYSFYRGAWSALPDFGTLTPVSEGTITEWDLWSVTNPLGGINSDYGLRISGMIEIARAGDYTFFTESDDGSALYIGETKVVDNDGSHGMEEKSGTITLARGMHPITVTFFQAGGGEGLEVRWEGAGIAGKEDVPFDQLYAVTSDRATAFPGTVPDKQWADNRQFQVHIHRSPEGIVVGGLNSRKRYSVEVTDILGRIQISQQVSSRREYVIPVDRTVHGIRVITIRSGKTAFGGRYVF